jgi:hypothetical protein
MTVNSYPISDRISRRAGDDEPSMIFKKSQEEEEERGLEEIETLTDGY